MESSIVSDNSSLPKAQSIGDLVLWNGFWSHLPLIQSIQQILSDFKPRSSDVFLASYPKTGQTWLKSLLFCIINRSSRNSLLTTHPQKLIPTMEVDSYGQFAKPHDSYAGINSSTRIFATHMPYQVLAKIVSSSTCHVVYITRNPKDTIVSTWHFRQKSKTFQNHSDTLESMVNRFCDGTTVFGPYFDHVLGYKEESLLKPEKVFFITYEELKNDTKKHVKRLAEFLGCPFVGDEDEDVLDEIVSICSFEKISKYEMNKSDDYIDDVTKFPLNSFFRRGEIEDYKNYLTTNDINHIDKVTKEKFHGSGFMYGI